MASVELHPIPASTAAARRLPQLFAGLILYGASTAMLTRAGQGVNPWNVLHEGLSEKTGLTFGTVTALTGAVVLLLWIPLRERPGIGTLANVITIAITVDLVRLVLDDARSLVWQLTLMTCGIVLNGLATAVYVGARLGAGPRDGLMTGLSARTGRSVRLVRTSIEVAVLAAGWLLGGTVGLGTAAYAVAIGPLTQLFLPFVAFSPRTTAR